MSADTGKDYYAISRYAKRWQALCTSSAMTADSVQDGHQGLHGPRIGSDSP